MRRLVIISILLILVGCEKTTEIKLPEKQELLSMDARTYISDSLIILPGISASLTGGQLPESRMTSLSDSLKMTAW
jgi:uncharacterized protein YcfL